MLKPCFMTSLSARALLTIGLFCLLFSAGGPVAFSQAPAATELRAWTDVQGRAMQAKMTGMEGDQVLFLLASGQSVKVPLARLSAADQDFINKSGPGAAAPAAITVPASSTSIPIEKRVWPQVVEVPTRSIEISMVEENPDQKRCVYRSESFEFIAEDKLAGSVMKEIARTFEATRALVDALPWGINPKPPADIGRYQAKFYETRASYFAEGGPENSGGVYFSGDRIFRIPFQSLGLDMRGKTWFMDASYRNDTIIHEITHQLMHDYLNLLPTWVIEGTAEYTESIPYNAGRFQAAKHEVGLKDYIRQRESTENMTLSEFRPLMDHMKMLRPEWDDIASNSAGQSRAMRQLYFQSYVLVYYFNHLDGDGKGTRFLKYLDAMGAEKTRWNEYNVKMLVYRKALDEFLKLPGVKKLEDGRFSYPSELTPPQAPEQPGGTKGKDFGVEKLELLLDGRTPEQLETDVKTAFKKLGLKW
ncbi:hypothetical protein BH11VER1_BH11VER1_20690 [soil metagenome]